MRLSILVWAFLFALNVHAVDNQQTYTTHGLGTESCERFIAAADLRKFDNNWSNWNRFSDWLNGYVTAYNRFVENGRKDIARNTDHDGRMSYIESFCRKNPAKDFSDASQALIEKLVISWMDQKQENAGSLSPGPKKQ